MNRICPIKAVIYLFACIVTFHVSAQNTQAVNSRYKALSDTEKISMLISPLAPDCANASALLATVATAWQLSEKAQWYNGMKKADNMAATIYFNCYSDYNRAVAYYAKNAALAKSHRKPADEALALESIAKCYEKLGQHRQALAYFDKALDLKPGAELEIGLWADMGFTYNSIGDYANALSAYVRSLQQLDESVRKRKKGDLQDTMQRSGLLMNIGDIYQSMSQPDKALENYNLVHDISRQIDDPQLQIYSLIGIGSIYHAEEEYSKALEVFNEALTYIDSSGNPADESVILMNIANVYLEIDKPAMAMQEAAKALQIGNEQNNIAIQTRSYTILGKAYLALGNYAGAVSYIEKALKTYQSRGELDEEKDAWQALSAAYEKMGQPSRSLDAFHHYIAIRDSIYNIKKANELTRIDLEFRYSRKQLSDSLKQAGIYEKNIQRQKFISYSSYIGLAMVLLLMFFIYRNYITQKKYNMLLSKERKSHLAHIQEQSNVLTDIAHTQSHDVRGPLATVLGLVQLFNHEDPADPVNKVVIDGVASKMEELDTAIKEVVTKENRLRKKQSR